MRSSPHSRLIRVFIGGPGSNVTTSRAFAEAEAEFSRAMLRRHHGPLDTSLSPNWKAFRRCRNLRRAAVLGGCRRRRQPSAGRRSTRPRGLSDPRAADRVGVGGQGSSLLPSVACGGQLTQGGWVAVQATTRTWLCSGQRPPRAATGAPHTHRGPAAAPPASMTCWTSRSRSGLAVG